MSSETNTSAGPLKFLRECKVNLLRWTCRGYFLWHRRFIQNYGLNVPSFIRIFPYIPFQYSRSHFSPINAFTLTVDTLGGYEFNTCCNLATHRVGWQSGDPGKSCSWIPKTVCWQNSFLLCWCQSLFY